MRRYRFSRIAFRFPSCGAISCLLLILFLVELAPIPAHSSQQNPARPPQQGYYIPADTTVTTPEILQIYKQIFKQAYDAAPDLRKARAEQSQKSAQRYTAWAKRLAPSVRASFSQVHDFNPDEDTVSENPDTPQVYSYSDRDNYQDWRFILNLPIYQRSVSVALAIARADEELAINTLRIRTHELDLKTRELLGQYLIASYRLLNLDNSILLSQKHVAKIRRGYELRDQTRLQLLRAEANLKELESRRDLDRNRRETALRKLLEFTGLETGDEVLTELLNLLQDEGSTSGAINSLADLQQAYKAIRPFIEEFDEQKRKKYFFKHSLLYTDIRLKRQLALCRASMHTSGEWPGLNVQGIYERKEDTQFSKFDGEGTLSLVLSVPLFSGGTLFSNQKTRAMAEQIANISHRADTQKILHSIEDNVDLIRNLRRVYQIQQAHLRQQEEIVQLSLESYAIKQTSMQDLLTSKNRLIDAKNALMETTTTLGALYRQFAWQIGLPFPSPTTQ